MSSFRSRNAPESHAEAFVQCSTSGKQVENTWNDVYVDEDRLLDGFYRNQDGFRHPAYLRTDYENLEGRAMNTNLLRVVTHESMVNRRVLIEAEEEPSPINRDSHTGVDRVADNNMTYLEEQSNIGFRQSKIDDDGMANMNTQGYHPQYRQTPSKPSEKPSTISVKNRVRDSKLHGLIFMCSDRVRKNCFRYGVFGMPLTKKDLVNRVSSETKLFLFECESRTLYGVYEANSEPGINIEKDITRGAPVNFPAQVRFRVSMKCDPLPEDIFREAIEGNYYRPTKFNFELSQEQVLKLLQMFTLQGTMKVGADHIIGINRSFSRSLNYNNSSRLTERTDGFVLNPDPGWEDEFEQNSLLNRAHHSELLIGKGMAIENRSVEREPYLPDNTIEGLPCGSSSHTKNSIRRFSNMEMANHPPRDPRFVSSHLARKPFPVDSVNGPPMPKMSRNNNTHTFEEEMPYEQRRGEPPERYSRPYGKAFGALNRRERLIHDSDQVFTEDDYLESRLNGARHIDDYLEPRLKGVRYMGDYFVAEDGYMEPRLKGARHIDEYLVAEDSYLEARSKGVRHIDDYIVAEEDASLEARSKMARPIDGYLEARSKGVRHIEDYLAAEDGYLEARSKGVRHIGDYLGAKDDYIDPRVKGARQVGDYMIAEEDYLEPRAKVGARHVDDYLVAEDDYLESRAKGGGARQADDYLVAEDDYLESRAKGGGARQADDYLVVEDDYLKPKAERVRHIDEYPLEPRSKVARHIDEYCAGEDEYLEPRTKRVRHNMDASSLLPQHNNSYAVDKGRGKLFDAEVWKRQDPLCGEGIARGKNTSYKYRASKNMPLQESSGRGRGGGGGVFKARRNPPNPLSDEQKIDIRASVWSRLSSAQSCEEPSYEPRGGGRGEGRGGKGGGLVPNRRNPLPGPCPRISDSKPELLMQNETRDARMEGEEEEESPLVDFKRRKCIPIQVDNGNGSPRVEDLSRLGSDCDGPGLKAKRRIVRPQIAADKQSRYDL